jgi:hypothetical protein
MDKAENAAMGRKGDQVFGATCKNYASLQKMMTAPARHFLEIQVLRL